MDGLTVVLGLALFLGVVAGTTLVVRSPSFWAGLGKALLGAALPKVVTVVTARMSPEEEARYQACVRAGGTWDPSKKRCK